MRRTPILILVLVSVLAIGFAGCTPQSQNGDSGGAAKVNIDSKNTPSPDGIFRIALLTNPPDLDPILISDTTSDGIARKVFNTLMGYDSELNLMPELADGMPTVAADSKTYTFKLRQGVKFHNGREMKAADVAYSLNRLTDVRSKRFNVIEPVKGAKASNEAAQKGEKLPIEGIRVKDDYTVEIELEEPFYPFLYLLAMTNASIVPKEVVDERGDGFSRTPVGTGPFVLNEWEENNFLKLAAFADYFEGAPKLKGFHYRVIPEPLARQEEYKAGNLDIVDVTQGMYPKWLSSNHAEDVTEWPQLAVEYYGFNLEKEGSPFAGFSDKAKKLRLAVNYAVDREHICKNIVEGRRSPSNGVLPMGMPGHNDERPVFKKDVAKAKELLAEAGHPNGEGLGELTLWFNHQGDNAKIAQAVQFDLKQVGIELTLKQLDWGAFIQAADAGEPAFFRLGWVADYPDPENFLIFLFHSRNKGPQGNVSFYGNPEVDKLIDASNAETDRDKRLKMLMDAEAKIIEDCPWLFLTLNKEVVLLKPYVKNFKPTGMDDDVACSHVKWHLVELDGGDVPQ